MNRFFQKVLIAVLAIIVCGASSLRAQSVNMDRYMTITVKQGASILQYVGRCCRYPGKNS